MWTLSCERYVRVWIREKIDFIDSIFHIHCSRLSSSNITFPSKKYFPIQCRNIVIVMAVNGHFSLCIEWVAAFIVKNQFWHFQLFTFARCEREKENLVIVLTVDQYAHSYHYANRRAHIFAKLSADFSIKYVNVIDPSLVIDVWAF